MSNLVYFPFNVEVGKPSEITGVTYTLEWLQEQLKELHGEHIYYYPGESPDDTQLGHVDYIVGVVKDIKIVNRKCYLCAELIDRSGVETYLETTASDESLELEIEKIKAEIHDITPWRNFAPSKNHLFATASVGNYGDHCTKIQFRGFYLITQEFQNKLR